MSERLYNFIRMAIIVGLLLLCPTATGNEQLTRDPELSCDRQAELEHSATYTPPRIRPFEFILGLGKLDFTLEHSLRHMCVGEHRTISLPPLEPPAKSPLRKRHSIPLHVHLECVVRCTSVVDRHHRKHTFLTNVFDEIDVDGDRKITHGEVKAYYKEVHNMDHVPESFWEHEDVDEDKVVTWEEFSGPKGLDESHSHHHKSSHRDHVVPHTLKVDHSTFKKHQRDTSGAHGRFHRHRGVGRDEL